MHFHIQKLASELERRVSKNPRYSLRAFATHVGLHPSALCRVLAGKQELSPKASTVIVEKLNFADEDKRLFLQSVADARNESECRRLGQAMNAPDLRPKPLEISEQHFTRILNVDCMAILELSLVKDFRDDSAWISQRLGLPAERVNECLENLINAGLLERVDGQLRKVQRLTTAVKSEATDKARSRLMFEMLERAEESLTKHAFEKRIHCGVFMAADPEKIKVANRMIMEFMEKLCDVIEPGASGDVYQLSLQLFPLTEERPPAQELNEALPGEVSYAAIKAPTNNEPVS